MREDMGNGRSEEAAGVEIEGVGEDADVGYIR
jgi:hypothetical protein